MSKAKLNKSELIRAYAAAHPDAKPKQIAEALTRQTGTEFKANVVSTTLSNAKRSGSLVTTTAEAVAVAAEEVQPQPQTNGKADPLDSAIVFVRAAGGLEQAARLLDRIRQIKQL